SPSAPPAAGSTRDSANSSPRRRPQPINIATIAWSRNARAVDGGASARSRRPLLGRQPVSESNPDSPHTFHSADAGHQLSAHETGVRRFVRDYAERQQGEG